MKTSLHRLPALLVPVLLFLAAPDARAWQTHLVHQYENLAYDVAFAPDGSVVIAGLADLSGDLGKALVAKLNPDGTLAWQRFLEPYGSEAHTIDVDANGDVLVGALVAGEDESFRGRLIVVKLAGATGAEKWRHSPPDHVEGQMIVDADGNPILSVGIEFYVPEDDVFSYRFVCRKLANADGAVVWEHDDCGRVEAADSAGNVFVGDLHGLAKLAHDDGHEVWHAMPLPFSAETGWFPQMAVDPAGNLAVGEGAYAAKIAGADGGVEWVRQIDPFDGYGHIYDVAVDAEGNVIVAGNSKLLLPRGTKFVVIKLKASNGRKQWRRILRNRGNYAASSARAVAVDPSGDVVVGGATNVDGPLVMKLSGRRGKQIWRQTPDGGVTALDVDGTGAVATVGGFNTPDDANTPTDDSTSGFAVTRLDAAGNGVTPAVTY